MSHKTKNKPELVELAVSYGLPTAVDGKDLNKKELVELIETHEDKVEKAGFNSPGEKPSDDVSKNLQPTPEGAEEGDKEELEVGYPGIVEQIQNFENAEIVDPVPMLHTRKQLAKAKAKIKELEDAQINSVPLQKFNKLKAAYDAKVKIINDLKKK